MREGDICEQLERILRDQKIRF